MKETFKRKGKTYPRPTLQQSIFAWCLLNDLIELGYPHNFQHEPLWIKSYMYKAADLVAEAYRIRNAVNNEAA